MRNIKLRVWVDGACEPINPGGWASYGVIVKLGDNVLFSDGKVVGFGQGMSNNVGEYSGLIGFLEWFVVAKDKLNLANNPVVFSDSRMLINQAKGLWKVKRGLYVPYYLRAQELINKLKGRIDFQWIPRGQNKEADQLSKTALLDCGVKLEIQKQV